MNHAPINEIVSLLEQFLPDKLSLLKKQFPEYADLLKSGQVLGDGNEKLLAVKISVCVAGLNLIIEKCKEIMPRLKRKIHRISRLQLASQIVVITSGATIISTLQSQGYNWVKYFSAILVLIGSILGIYVQHISTSVYNDSSLFNVYSSLNENYLKAEQQLIDIGILSQATPLDEISKAEITTIIQAANATCVQIRKIISQY